MWQSFLDSGYYNLVFVFSLMLTVAGGILLARYYRKKKHWEGTGVEGAVIGIFGLIISFSFLQAGNAHRERSSFIHEEADAIDKLYRYSKQMPDSFAKQTRSTLLEFLGTQLSFNNREMENGNQAAINILAILSDYWKYLVNYEKQIKDANQHTTLEKIKNSYDQLKYSLIRHAYSYGERTPPTITFLLTVTSLLVGFLVGFMSGIRENIHYLVSITYIIMIALVMIVIRDLNDPLKGNIRPNYFDLQRNFTIIQKNQ